MKKLLMTIAIALSMMTAAADAKMIRLSHDGAWSTEFWTDDGNGAMCTMTTSWRWPNGATGMVQFKWQNGDWFSHITKSNWRIPSGTEIPMTIWFDNGDKVGVGVVHEDQRGGSTIHIGFNNDTAGFLADVGNAREMRITFDSGNEEPWITKTMNGSRKAVAQLNACINWIKGNAPTQPGAQSRTQPAPAPTQPGSTSSVKKPKDDGGI